MGHASWFEISRPHQELPELNFAPCSCAAPRAKARAPPGAVFGADGLHRLGVQAQAFFGCARGQFVQIVARAEASLSGQDLQAGVLAEVPHLVDFDGLPVEQASVFVLDPDAQHPSRHAQSGLALG